MERLTEKFYVDYVPKELFNLNKDGILSCNHCYHYCKTHESKDYGVDCLECAIGKCFNKLGEYEDLEEQGKLLKPPVAVGDMLFVLTEDSPTGIEETRCKSIVFNSKNNFIVYAPCQYDDWGQAKWRFKKSHFEKTVFLTKEAAEAALKEMSE